LSKDKDNDGDSGTEEDSDNEMESADDDNEEESDHEDIFSGSLSMYKQKLCIYLQFEKSCKVASADDL